MIFSAEMPETVKFGRGVRHLLPELLPPGNVMVICGAHAFKEVSRDLLPKLESRNICLISSFPAEAPLDEVETALKTAREQRIVAVVGWGGGSAIDGAKAIAALAGSEGPAADYFYNRRPPAPRSVYFAAVPTTAGTGAEITPNAVLCDKATGVKQSLRGENLFADAALVDPELLENAPDRVLFSAGFDALTQAVESTISRRADNLSRMLAHEAAARLWNGLQNAAAGTKTPEVFDALARGSMVTGCAFVRSGLGAVHGIGHPAGSRGHVPHGVCCAILLPEILRWNLPAARDTLSETARHLGFESPEKFISAIEQLRERCSLPGSFRSFGLGAADIPFIVAHCRSGSMKSNPRDLTDAEVAQILKKLI